MKIAEVLRRAKGGLIIVVLRQQHAEVVIAHVRGEVIPRDAGQAHSRFPVQDIRLQNLDQRDIAALSLAEGVGFTVQAAASLAAEVVRILSLSPEQKQALSDKARGLIDRNQGVAARCVEKVVELLGN